MAELTVVISYYKAIDNLKLILKALNQQSKKDFEVILSEDDYNEETKVFLENTKQEYSFPIIHIYQLVDDGFRKNEMLNRAVLKATTEKLAFIDGDCIPHKHFVKNYIKSLNPDCIYDGRAVLLDEKTTQILKSSQSFSKLKLSNLIFTDSMYLKDGIYFPYFSLSFNQKGRGLVGRNWGICKSTLLKVNGFDMDYIHAGVGEDTDIEWRLKAIGVKSKSMKNNAIVYHLYHPKGYSDETVQNNMELMFKKQILNNIRCLNGIQSLIDTSK